MKRKLLSLTLALTLALALASPAAGAFNSVDALKPSSPTDQRVGILSADATQTVPLRAAVESCGGTVIWDNGSVEIIHENLSATIQIGSNAAVIDGAETTLDFVPIINEQGRTVVSYDFLRPVFVDEEDEYAGLKDYVIPLLYALMDGCDAAGLTLSVVDMGNDDVWSQGFGYADVENSVAVTEDTLFEVGSISKTFTAMGVMQLKEDGLLDLDTPIVEYIPEFYIAPHPDRGGDSGDITLRMISNHTSGVQGTISSNFISYDPANALKFNSIIEDLNSSFLAAAPGDTQAYSNTAVTLMGAVLAVAAYPGESFVDGFLKYMDENVFAGMGMDSTSFVPVPELSANVSNSYTYASAGAEETLYISQLPAGSAASTAEDMAKYMQTLLGGGTFNGIEVLSEQSVAELLTPTAVGSDRYTFDDEMGIIWMSDDIGKTIINHGGNTVYFNSMVAIDPDTGLGVFLSCNTASSALYITAYAYDILKTAIEMKTGETLTAPVYPETQAVTLSDEELLPYTGIYSYYSTAAGLNGSGGLTLSIMGIELTLTPQNDGTFLDGYGNRYLYKVMDDGSVGFWQYAGTTAYYICDVLETPSTEFSENFEGAWSYADKSDTFLYQSSGAFYITSEMGYPVMLSEGITLPIVCVDDTTAYIPGYGRDCGIVMKLAEADGATYLEYSGGRFERIIAEG